MRTRLRGLASETFRSDRGRVRFAFDSNRFDVFLFFVQCDKAQGECSGCGQGACTHSLLHNTCPSKTVRNAPLAYFGARARAIQHDRLVGVYR